MKSNRAAFSFIIRLTKQQHLNSTTAILIFTRSSTAEAAGKKILCNSKQNLKAFSGLIKHTIKTASGCGLAWYISDETSQKGSSFGEKLTDAIISTFARGYKKLIVLGNDCPGLNQHILQKAIQELDKNDCVLGPDSNGGVYLMGLSSVSFKKNLFEKIRWQTQLVFSQLQESNNGCVILRKMHDVNHDADIAYFKKQTQLYNSLIILLVDLFFSGLSRYFKHSSQLVYTYTASVNHRRGPPLNA